MHQGCGNIQRGLPCCLGDEGLVMDRSCNNSHRCLFLALTYCFSVRLNVRDQVETKQKTSTRQQEALDAFLISLHDRTSEHYRTLERLASDFVCRRLDVTTKIDWFPSRKSNDSNSQFTCNLSPLCLVLFSQTRLSPFIQALSAYGLEAKE